MDLFYKMPINLSKAAKFFNKISNNILRDFHELIVMARREKFSRHAIEDFYEKAKEVEEVKVFFDGEENFKKGMNLFSFAAIEDNAILIYECFSTTFFWGTSEEFFVNGIRCKEIPAPIMTPRIIDCALTPLSLQTAWFFSGSIDGFVCKDTRFESVLANVSEKNFLYHR